MIWIFVLLAWILLMWSGATPEGRSWWVKTWAWINPYDFKTGVVDGRRLRARDHAQKELAEAERDHQTHLDAIRQKHEDMVAENKEQQAEPQEGARGRFEVIDTRRRGAFLRVQDEDFINGEISVGVTTRPQDYADKYGTPKTETEKTLDKLKRLRKTEADYEQGY